MSRQVTKVLFRNQGILSTSLLEQKKIADPNIPGGP